MTVMDLGGEPVPDRCGRCGKPMCADVGAGLWGQPQVITFCLSCGVQPEEIGWEATLTAAVAAVKARRTS